LTATSINLIVVSSFALVILLASILGRKPERIGAGILGVGLLFTLGAQALAGGSPLFAFMVIDFLMALGLAVLTFRYPEKLWPGLAGCAQLLVFVFSATRAIDFPMSETTYLAALNLSCLGVTTALAGGTWAARWYRSPPSEWDLSFQETHPVQSS
jgi:hypothetical protein